MRYEDTESVPLSPFTFTFIPPAKAIKIKGLTNKLNTNNDFPAYYAL
jgi:hypothetical protein